MSNVMEDNRFLGPVSFYKQALKVAIPVILQTFLMSFVSIIDSFMVAGLGDEKMAGVNVANQFNFVFIVLLSTISGAGGIFLAQFNGAGNQQGMRQAFRFKLIISLFFGLIYFFLSQVFPDHLMRLLVNGNTAAEGIITHGKDYLQTVSWAVFPMIWVSSAASSLRDIGDTKNALYFAVVAAIINTVINYLLIEGNFGAPRLEGFGAAIATVFSRVIEALLIFIYLMKLKPPFLFNLLKLFTLDVKLFMRILHRSWMMLSSELTWVISETIVTAVYNSRGGAEVVAGMSSGWSISNLFFSVFGGIFVVGSVLIGSELGADRAKEAKLRAKWLLNGSWILGIGVGLLHLGTILLIPLIFSNLSTSAREVTSSLILVVSLYIPFWVYITTQFAISRSGGDVLQGFVVDMIVNICIFIPLVFLLSMTTNWSAVEIFLVSKLSDIAKIVIGWFWLKKEYWVKNLNV